MKEKVVEAAVHVLSAAMAGGAAHVLYGRLLADRQGGMAHDTQRALIHAPLSVAATVLASAIVRRAL